MAGHTRPLNSMLPGYPVMITSLKSFFKNQLPDIIRRRLGNRIMATIIVSITLVMGVEIVLDLYFGKKDTIELMETLSSSTTHTRNI